MKTYLVIDLGIYKNRFSGPSGHNRGCVAMVTVHSRVSVCRSVVKIRKDTNISSLYQLL